MTNNEIRIACAEGMGWTRRVDFVTPTWGHPDVAAFAFGVHQLPDYTTSCDAALTLCDEEWCPQESTPVEDNARYWLGRHRRSNAETFEPGAGREFVLLKRTPNFELA